MTTAGYTPRDVNASIESWFGTIPASCRSDRSSATKIVVVSFKHLMTMIFGTQMGQLIIGAIMSFLYPVVKLVKMAASGTTVLHGSQLKRASNVILGAIAYASVLRYSFAFAKRGIAIVGLWILRRVNKSRAEVTNINYWKRKRKAS